MLPPTLDAFFATPRQGPLGARFCIWQAPADVPAQGIVVYVHPFAEEMNRARRMAALQSRALAAQGHAVLQMDLLGCGDSAGDFGEATWAAWVDDVVDACALARQRFDAQWPGVPRPPLWLWGLRAGCLLAAEAAPRIEGASRFVFWQAATNGATVLQQFLRVATVRSALGKSEPGQGKSPRDMLAEGRPVTVAGYEVHPGLASGLDAARLRPPPGGVRSEWLNVASGPGARIAPALAQVQAEWAAAGLQVRHHEVVGPAFWQTTEIEEAPDLLVATPASMAHDEASIDGDALMSATGSARLMEST